MNLPALFSLIFATLLGLLPIFLLVGRRVLASRSATPGNGAPAPGRTGSPESAEANETAGATRIGVGTTGDPAGGSLILDRIIQDRRRTETEDERRRRASAAARRARDSQRELYEAAHIAGVSPEQRHPASALESRLARLTPLQRAVVYREVLGRPIGLRDPGSEEY